MPIMRKLLVIVLTVLLLVTMLPAVALEEVEERPEVEYTIDDGGNVLVQPTSEQWDKLLEVVDEKGVLKLVGPEIEDMTAGILEADLVKLTGSDNLRTFIFSAMNMEICVPRGALEGMKIKGDRVRFGLKPGSLVFELTDAEGEVVYWYDYRNPVTVSVPAAPPQDINTRQVVMVDRYGGGGEIIPRSWYAEGKVFAKVCTTGTYAAAVSVLGEFADTTGLWMEDSVGYIAARVVALGVGDEMFDTDATITRAHFLTMIMRMLYLQLDYEEAMPPEDYESAPDWAKESIRAATALGLTLRDEDGNFSPNAPILRQEMFFMAYEAMQICGMIPAVFTQEWIEFTDWEGNVKGEYGLAIQNLCKLGLVSGYGDGMLNPNGESTRAEGAQFLCNILKYDAK